MGRLCRIKEKKVVPLITQVFLKTENTSHYTLQRVTSSHSHGSWSQYNTSCSNLPEKGLHFVSFKYLSWKFFSSPCTYVTKNSEFFPSSPLTPHMAGSHTMPITFSFYGTSCTPVSSPFQMLFGSSIRIHLTISYS